MEKRERLKMGPAILIDKSTLQSLSEKEVFYLQQYYHIVYCPTLFYEILGDLTKHKDLEASKKEVLKVSCKIYGGDSCFTTDFRTVLVANLLGHKVEMDDGRPLLPGGREVIDGDGKKGMFFDEQPEYDALRKWTNGEFSKAEKLHSKNWRSSLKEIDLSIAQINSEHLKHVKNFDDLWKYTATILETNDEQWSFLQFLLKHYSQDLQTRNQICERWLKCGMPNIKEFAPYAYYCLSAYWTLYFGVAKGLVGARPSNIIDLEYILYMPFCKFFTSTDKFLRDFSQTFLTEGQDFIWGNDLKDDLKSFCKYWEAKGDKARFSYQEQYGSYPPDIPNSLTCEIWKRWAGERKKQRKMTPEEEQKLLQKLKPILDRSKKE